MRRRTTLVILLVAGVAMARGGVPATRLATGPVVLPYSTGGSQIVAGQIDGVDVDSAKGVELEIISRHPTQLKVYLVPKRGPARFRYLVLSASSPSRKLVLPIEAFDPDPVPPRQLVLPAGSMVIVDCPGFFREGLENEIAVGPLRMLDKAPPMPADESPPGPEVEKDELYRRILGGWIGKLSGGAAGMSNEGKLEAKLAEVDAAAAKGLPDATWGFGPDDDSSFEVQHLLVAGEKGASFGGVDLVRSWLNSFCREYLWKTERYAIGLIAKGIRPPQSGQNPYGESLCARIRADLWGYLAPGDPARALEFVGRDAPVANCDEGVRAAEFAATLVSLAFKGGKVDDLVAAALEAQPRTDSKHARLIRRCLDDYRKGVTLEQALSGLQSEVLASSRQSMPSFGWVHALPNTGLMVLALLHGGGDYARTVALATNLGWDTDCNAATAGCVLGVLGTDTAIPERFRARLHDRLRVAVAGHEHWSIRRLAQRTLEVRGKVASGAPK